MPTILFFPNYWNLLSKCKHSEQMWEKFSSVHRAPIHEYKYIIILNILIFFGNCLKWIIELVGSRCIYFFYTFIYYWLFFLSYIYLLMFIVITYYYFPYYLISRPNRKAQKNRQRDLTRQCTFPNVHPAFDSGISHVSWRPPAPEVRGSCAEITDLLSAGLRETTLPPFFQLSVSPSECYGGNYFPRPRARKHMSSPFPCPVRRAVRRRSAPPI